MNTTPTVTIFNYTETSLEEKAVTFAEGLKYKDAPGVTWIDIQDAGEKEAIEQICESFGLHQLVRESLLEHNKRPKIEDHGSYVFIVFDTLVKAENCDEMKTEAFDMVLGEHYCLTFRNAGASDKILEPIKKRIRAGGTRIRRSAADYLAYRIIDALVDNYFSLLEWYGENIEEVEEEMFVRGEKDILPRIQKLRREMLFLRESIWPIREILNSLQRGESCLIQPDTRIYMRDVYDHTVQIIETLETSRDMMSSMLEIYLSTVNNRLNEVMKLLTVISTIFIPLTFVTSIYGMNFHYLPEITWRWGYYMVWGIMLLMVTGMLTYFKKKRWF